MFQDLLDLVLIATATWLFLYILFWSTRKKPEAVETNSKSEKGAENGDKSSGSSRGVERQQPSEDVQSQKPGDRLVRDPDDHDHIDERKDLRNE